MILTIRHADGVGLESQMEELTIPGLSFALINDGQVVHHKTLGYANLEQKLPVIDKTIFEGASLSKSVFAFFCDDLRGRGQTGSGQTAIRVPVLVFILGYILQWQYTPIAMACVYAAMTILCAVETFGYMESESRFIAMGIEYLAYAGILIFLFQSRIFQADDFDLFRFP